MAITNELYECPVCKNMSLTIKGELLWNTRHTMQKITETKSCLQPFCYRSTRLVILDRKGRELAYYYKSESPLSGGDYKTITRRRGNEEYFYTWNDNE